MTTPAPARRRMALLCVALALGVSRPAHADSWQAADFTSPGDKPARGLATDASNEPGVRLVIGCELPPDGSWRGMAVFRSASPDAAARDVDVVVTFIGRAPVKERWHALPHPGGLEVLWPESSDPLRRNLLREDSTRGHASVSLEIVEPDRKPARSSFKVEGLAARSAELAAACAGWGAPAARSGARRDEAW